MSWLSTDLLAADVAENHATRVVLEGRSVLLIRWQGVLYAVSGRCPHAGADLSHGRLANGRLHCPMHGWKFDVTTGHPVYPPDEGRPLRTYPIRLDHERIWVDMG